MTAVLELLGPYVEAGSRNEIQELFLTRVARYGAGLRRGYDHDEMQSWAAYQTPWVHRFGRAYDMNSEEIDVLRLADVERRRFVSADTVKFIINLPDDLPSEDSPLTDLVTFAADLVK